MLYYDDYIFPRVMLLLNFYQVLSNLIKHVSPTSQFKPIQDQFLFSQENLLSS
jgi:hypothetical protein